MNKAKLLDLGHTVKIWQTIVFRAKQRYSNNSLAENSESLADAQKRSTDELRSAFETLEPILGLAAIESIIDDLEKRGVTITDAHAQYSVIELQSALADIFGIDIAAFMIRHIARGLFRIKNR